MSKKVRLHKADDIETFANAVSHFRDFGSGLDDDNEILQFRPRTSSTEDDWQDITDDHLPNMERFNYRFAEPPRLRLEGNEVYDTDDNYRPLTWVKRLIEIARRCRRTKRTLLLPVGEKDCDPEEEHPVTISRSGNVKIGCQDYSWEDFMAFERRYLRKK